MRRELPNFVASILEICCPFRLAASLLGVKLGLMQERCSLSPDSVQGRLAWYVLGTCLKLPSDWARLSR